MISVKNRKNYKGPGEYIGRPSPLGNPFKITPNFSREDVIFRYRKWIYEAIKNKDEKVVNELKRLLKMLKENGKLILICWCAPLSCHGDVIAEVLEQMFFEKNHV
jgi:hypothetical protein